MIKYSETSKTFFLNTKNTTYAMTLRGGVLCHTYWGNRVEDENLSDLNIIHWRTLNSPIKLDDITTSMTDVPQEFPTFGRGDYRSPAIMFEGTNGCRNCDLRYVSHKIYNGKPVFLPLPQLDNTTECDTLEITLADEFCGVEVKLLYSVFEKEDVITRRTIFKNTNDEPIKLINAYSASLDMFVPNAQMISFEGTWARERQVNRHNLFQGTTSLESRRGSSSHHLNPSAILTKPTTTENSGEAWGFALVYSADFKISAEVDHNKYTRLQIGVNPETFAWQLKKGEDFVTPEALMTYSAKGFNKLSQNFHDVTRNHLGALADKNLRHPIIINCWEAMYFDISEEKMIHFIDACKGLGIETVVMDDGWFGHREMENSSLGDWYPYPKKFPNDLYPVIDHCKKSGMNFGIWVEPEMISEDSELYKKHPDWCIHEDGRKPVEGRNQLILDLTRPEVVDGAYEIMANLLTKYDIAYVKWDMNRNLTDRGSAWLGKERQGEFAHRFILGVYELMARLKKNFPHVFFEGCSGGGGRVDFGNLYYQSQIWTSDCTDAVSRLRIQYGTSMIYPPAAMVGHVSACPNNATGWRVTPFKTRADVAQMCNFGYELHVAELPEEDKEQIKGQVLKHRELEPLIANGNYYRLKSPFESDHAAWMLVSDKKDTAWVMFAFQHVIQFSDYEFLRLEGLDENKRYFVEELNKSFSGAALMNLGLPIPSAANDYGTFTFNLKEVK